MKPFTQLSDFQESRLCKAPMQMDQEHADVTLISLDALLQGQKDDLGQAWCEEESVLSTIFGGFPHTPVSTSQEAAQCAHLAKIVSRFVGYLVTNQVIGFDCILCQTFSQAEFVLN